MRTFQPHFPLSTLHFTLIEMVVVAAMILLVAGIALQRFGGSASGVSLENQCLELESFFTQAGRVGAVRGKTVEVMYSPEERRFAIVNPLPQGASGNQEYLSEKYHKLRIADGIELEAEKFLFRCFPDGTASGPEIRLRAGDQAYLLKLSPLTGSFQRRPAR